VPAEVVACEAEFVKRNVEVFDELCVAAPDRGKEIGNPQPIRGGLGGVRRGRYRTPSPVR